MKTRHEEIIKRTADLQEMQGKYLAERLLRSWEENFTDVDTGEVVTIERHEILFERGCYINSDILSQINFYLQSESIKDVAVSNQMRHCLLANNSATVWSVTTEINSKRKVFYLYSNNAYTTFEIVKDFIEQNYQGRFNIITIKESSYCVLVAGIEKDSVVGDSEYYKTLLTISDSNSQINREFIVKATDAEEAKAFIEVYLKKKKNEPFELTILSAKAIPCEALIDIDFCKKYLENDE